MSDFKDNHPSTSVVTFNGNNNEERGRTWYVGSETTSEGPEDFSDAIVREIEVNIHVTTDSLDATMLNKAKLVVPQDPNVYK